MADIRELAKHHNKWLETATAICNDPELAKDLVQDMYLKLYDCRNEINAGYVYRTIKSIFIDGIRKNRENNSSDFFDMHDTALDIFDSRVFYYKSKNSLDEVLSVHEEEDMHYETLLQDFAKQEVFDRLPTYKQIIITHSQEKGVRVFAIQSGINKDTISYIRNDFKKKICLENQKLINQQPDSETLLQKLQQRLGLNHAQDAISEKTS